MDRDTVRKTAKLARLHLGEDEIMAMGEDLDRILDYVKRLQAVDRLATPSGDPGRVMDEGADGVGLREDRPVEGVTPEQATENAPASEGGAFLVPRVIG